jgi:hypothetical protein
MQNRRPRKYSMGYWYLVCIIGTGLWVCYGYGNDNQDGTIKLHRGPASGCFKNKHVYGLEGERLWMETGMIVPTTCIF